MTKDPEKSRKDSVKRPPTGNLESGKNSEEGSEQNSGKGAEKGRKKMSTADSLLIVNTGDGKGKSTSAFGVMLRALSRNWKVAVIQFIKSGEWNTGEQDVATRLGVDWLTGGEGFTWESENIDDDEAVAKASWQTAEHIIQQGKHQLVILDEVTYPINWGWIDISAVVNCLKKRPTKVSVLMTGRDAPRELIEIADTVTEMNKVKHAFDRGIIAKRGIDY